MIKKLVSNLVILLKYKDLTWQLALKELAAQYRYPFLGIFWIFLMPLCLILVLVVIFSKLLRISVPGYPFPLYLVAGILPWTYFANSLAVATTKISESGSLVKNVYFPRKILIISVVLSNLINFIISLGMMFAVFMFFGIKYDISIMFLPFIIILESLFIIGCSLITSSLQVRYRDIRYVVEIFLLIIFYLTPIVYPVNLIKEMPENFSKIYLMNPFVGIITLYRIVILKGYMNTLYMSGVSFFLNVLICPIVCSVAVFIIGFLMFKKLEPNFADYL